ncbi:hypothetical protein [Cupriavidus sp. USMAA2-4]|uniref:hypothetical protein n=1 Tax=Cupriavidus sp. USMAA2-4 TaxID=876364 RepID=UPI000AEED776|nr:hypothetical protein [Cupriavidus sp. USMAA2-4]
MSYVKAAAILLVSFIISLVLGDRFPGHADPLVLAGLVIGIGISARVILRKSTA